MAPCIPINLPASVGKMDFFFFFQYYTLQLRQTLVRIFIYLSRTEVNSVRKKIVFFIAVASTCGVINDITNITCQVVINDNNNSNNNGKSQIAITLSNVLNNQK